MDRLIFSTILAIVAAIALGQVLKGVLRLIAMALIGLTLVLLSITFNSPDGGQFLTNLFNPDETNRVETNRVETDRIETNPVEANSTATDSRISRPLGSDESNVAQSTVRSPDQAFSGAAASAGAIPDETSDGNLSREFEDPSSESSAPESSSTEPPGVEQSFPPSSTPPLSKSRPIHGLW
ncbi:MAG: hypothetical protein F6K09_04250 [Merismopedia sp. SIO2A8]|nr:hypothetical protein [Merismopedia sp. SIO2A8]